MFSSALKSFGSNISANYQISSHPSVCSGPWKVHDAKKKSTDTAASVFIFERKFLEPRSGGLGGRSGSSAKKLQDEVVERLKREAGNLARLRHPSILQVLEPVEDTRGGGLMFVTEPITASLAGLLQGKDQQEGSRASRHTTEDSSRRRAENDFEIDELEIQKGLLQIAKGLEFLHESAGLVHGNLNPEAIYINAKSDWKISGLGFAGPAAGSETRSTLPPLALSEVFYQDPRLPQAVQLNLNYTSPDFVMDSNVTPSADLFSLGLIIIALYNYPHASPLQAHSNVNTYKKLLSSPATTPSQGNSYLSSRPLPKDVISHVLPRLITRRPAQRMSAREFQQSQYFDNVLVSTIRFLESLPAKNPSEKSQFMRGLQRVIPEFPASVLERKILGVLLEETKDRELLSLILQNVFLILQKIPNGRRVFPERIIPCLKEAFIHDQRTPAAQERDSKKDAGLMVVLDNVGVMADNCSGNEFRDDILPFIRLGLDSPVHSLVDAALKSLPSILPVLDFITVKNEVFPPIASTFSKTSSLAIKVRSLEAFAVLCGGTAEKADLEDDLTGIVKENKPASKSSILDKYTVQEKLVPSLKAIKTKEPAVMMAALKVFTQVGALADTDFLALEVLPILWSFSLGPLLNIQQFGEFMSLIKSLSAKIEREQIRKLQELSSTGSSSGFRHGAENNMKNMNKSAQLDSDGARDNFERLVLGRDTATSNGQETDQWATLDSSTAATQKSTQPSSPSFTWTSQTNAPVNRISSPERRDVSSVQANSNFRSITPDYHMGSFPSLEPASAQKSSLTSPFPALQPSTSIWNSSKPIGHQVPSPGPASNQSLSSLASMQSMQPSIPPMTTQSSNYSAFSIPPPPSSGSTSSWTGNLANTNMASLGGSFGGKPAMNTIQPSQFQPPASQKTGLDKYESLL
ncbi:hypothetical protein ASPZODRAFT_70952 [Penicilliopsis zonata CBS 506.65]|uniref:Protein kinase domain-containing protein n=1 Tax=Penicilliopsis zonata CBS 506.65 TaxID=1073090 RepID=A0A1L9SCE1_9EURO|nr:hypothetical protein ASPZODRAFT_70952 [Penicilliopsis zonata CBS 506.65]OJJ44813.1 hypothetical protein ASPZODRAFT_70952 [Penicilliopsis zonata CBS 506.65]